MAAADEGQCRYRDLIEQRSKFMVIVFIDQSDMDVFIAYKFMCAAHPCKAAAYNDHSVLFIHCSYTSLIFLLFN